MYMTSPKRTSKRRKQIEMIEFQPSEEKELEVKKEDLFECKIRS